jgi:uncharacterized membrane protein YccF (DUF307 family)
MPDDLSPLQPAELSEPSAAVVAVPIALQPPLANQQTTTVNVFQQPGFPMPMVFKNAGPGYLIRTVWYLLVGWWLSGVLMFVAAVCIMSVIGLPLALALVNRLPAVLTLRPTTRRLTLAMEADGSVEYTLRDALQRPLWQRAVYFALVGWWAAIVAMMIAWFLSLTIVGLPLALMVLNRLPAVLTLRVN